MGVDLIFRIAAIGILVAVLNQLLIRSGREEQAMICLLYTSRFVCYHYLYFERQVFAMDVLKKAWNYFRPYKRIMILCYCLTVVVIFLNMVNPYVTKIIFDSVYKQGLGGMLLPLLDVYKRQVYPLYTLPQSYIQFLQFQQ